MNQEKYIKDLKEIKEMMNRSGKFISLSGLSGISAGIIALVACYFAWDIIYSQLEYQNFNRQNISFEQVKLLFFLGMSTLVLAIGSGMFFTIQKARKKQQVIWDSQSKQLIINLLIPLVTGGTFCILLLFKGLIGLIAPLTLLFYGLALLNASKYTISEIRSLAIIEIVLGLVSCFFIGYGLLFWAIGFGVMHIVYGVIMELKDRS
jgi:hypothetical protein